MDYNKKIFYEYINITNMLEGENVLSNNDFELTKEMEEIYKEAYFKHEKISELLI